MVLPYIPEHLFELNSNLFPQFDGEVIIIDNLFKNYSYILDVCTNMPVEIWKSSPTSRNFKDYFDCRPIIDNHCPDKKMLDKRLSTFRSLISNFFKTTKKLDIDKWFVFNYFKHLKKDIPNNIQLHPHYDHYFNVITYIDPFENGGTAIYENQNIDLKEEENVLYDISKLKIKKIIPSKPNRCIIFPGNLLHGGYIKNHNVYHYNWRINLVNFILEK